MGPAPLTPPAPRGPAPEAVPISPSDLLHVNVPTPEAFRASDIEQAAEDIVATWPLLDCSEEDQLRIMDDLVSRLAQALES